MSEEVVSKKRKIVFWRPQPKRRKLSNQQWFRKSKSIQSKSAITIKPSSSHKSIQSKTAIKIKPSSNKTSTISNSEQNRPKKIVKIADKKDDDDNNDSYDDNDTFEIVKLSKPRFNTMDPNESNTDSSVLKIKFATPSKGKHTEYNLKSLQEAIIDNGDSLNFNDNKDDDDDSNNELEGAINIKTRNDIISTTSEWHKLGEINEYLLNHIRDFMKLSHPTIIQTKSIPHLLDHRDLLIKSETGSGKTLAYLIPIISDLMREITSRSDGCKVMIIAPTRELCLQIYNVTNILCRHTPFIVIGHIMGGEDKKKEKSRIRKGLSVVIGTPGRILDHFENTRCFKFDLIKWLVLDEADILLNLGFEKFMRSIVKIIDKKRSVMNRCNILVSATLDNRVHKLAQFVLNKHVFISLNEGDTEKEDKDNTYIPATLKHHYVCLKREYQSVGLIGLLRMLYYRNINKLNGFKVIIFMSTCSVINYYYELFKECKLFPNSSEKVLPLKHDRNGNDIKWFELRGDMTQKDRTKTFFEFCDIENGILFCTDVASRGLDIPSVNFIIQYDPPSKLQDYIHRSGRTARMGRAGQTILFLTPKEIKYLDILKKNNFVFNQMPIGHIWNQLDVDYEKYKLSKKNDNKEKSKENKRNNNYDAAASMLMVNYDNNLSNHHNMKLSSRNVIIDHLKSYVMNNNSLKRRGKDAMQTFIKAYTTYPRELKSIFYVQNIDFYQCSKCFFIEREGKFLRKGGMKYEIKRNKYSQQKANMRDVAQKITKKRNVPSTVSEFSSM